MTADPKLIAQRLRDSRKQVTDETAVLNEQLALIDVIIDEYDELINKLDNKVQPLLPPINEKITTIMSEVKRIVVNKQKQITQPFKVRVRLRVLGKIVLANHPGGYLYQYRGTEQEESRAAPDLWQMPQYADDAGDQKQLEGGLAQSGIVKVEKGTAVHQVQRKQVKMFFDFSPGQSAHAYAVCLKQ